MKTPEEKQRIYKLLHSKSGIKLDLGCGENKQPGFVGMDLREVVGVDIIHNIEAVPYPLPDECCMQILSSHVFEHICPRKFMGVMGELWRISKVGCQLLISMPYGVSPGFQQDPTHCNVLNEASWTYFDPEFFLYQIYKPMPWKVVRNAWQENGNMEVILEKRADHPDYHLPGIKMSGWGVINQPIKVQDKSVKNAHSMTKKGSK